MTIAGYTGNTVGENIAKGHTSIGTVTADLKASEEDCKEMMDPQYIVMGIYSYQLTWCGSSVSKKLKKT